MIIIMTGINTHNTQVLGFKGQQAGQPEKAAASLIIPGSGQIMDGRNKNGAVRLGVEAGLLAGFIATGRAIVDGVMKTSNLRTTKELRNLSKPGRRIADEKFWGSSTKAKAMITVYRVLIIGIIANHILAAVDAFKGKPKKLNNK